MPRIRKKTSKRGTTHERRRLQERIKESKRKKVKAAKKNPQWKSKHKKDPGIPNNFPYKDQILAEVAEQRRLAAEEKQRRKDAKKGLLADQVDVEVDDGSDNEPADEERPLDDDKDGDIQGVGSISAKRIASSRVSEQAVATEDDEEDEDEEAPLLINRDLPHLQSVLDAADAIIQVLDARDPLSFRSSHLEEVAEKAGKKVLFEAVEAWVRVLRKQHPTLLFRAATSFLPENPRVPADVKGKAKAKKPVADALGVESIQQCLQDWVKAKKGDSFTVAVVGVANVGKSSFVNSLLKKAILPVYEAQSSSRGPTTTSIPQEVTIDIEGSPIHIIDTPGFLWEWEEEKDAEETSKARSHDILIRNRGRIDRLKDPSLPISEIVTRSNPEDLMLLYNLPIFPRGDVQAFLAGVARAQQLVQKRGHLDITSASRIILRDWNIGQIRWYCAPSSKDVPVGSTSTESNEAIFSGLTSKKDMRRAGGLVKLTAGKIDERRLSLDDTYAAVEDDSDYSDDSEGDDDDQMEVDGDEDEDQDQDQEMSNGDTAAEDSEDQNEKKEREALSSNTNHKRKRTDPVAHPPSKKVAFAKAGDRSLPKAAISKASKLKAPPKSAMKDLNSAPPKKTAANVSSKTRPKMATSADDGEAYDFGKYF
ncbi:hypothetical protein WG66_013792 [Moniliophthora roreri]|nr:hypothetical protein WG66_013792 [Moniliophthora roreri]